MGVKELRLGEEVNQHFIKGLMKGYNNYLKVRLNADKELEISNGYAYTRGNYLEDSIAKEKTTSSVSFKHARAGSWAYLQFTVDKSDEKYLVIVRRSERIEDAQKELKKKTLEERKNNWLYSLSEYNNHLKLNSFNNSNNQQIKLFAGNPKEEKAIIKQMQLDIDLEEQYNGFYILSYEIDPTTYIIDDASLSMLDSQTLELIEVESLRSLVVENQSIIEDSLLINAKAIIGPEELSGEASEYIIQTHKEEDGESHEYSIEES